MYFLDPSVIWSHVTILECFILGRLALGVALFLFRKKCL